MFLLKNMFSQFLYPQPIVVILSILTVILVIRGSKKARIAVIVQLLFIVTISFRFVPVYITQKLESAYQPLIQPPHDVKTVVVLGGGATSDTTLPISSRLSVQSLIRLTEGIHQFNQLDSGTLIVTGGAVFDTVPIAVVQRQMAIQLGVDSTKIAMADRALTTEMEAEAVRRMVSDKRVILVTSATHMKRAVALFTKMGLEPIPAPTNYLVKKSPFTPLKLFPSSWNVYMMRTSIHEYFGIVWSMLRGKI